MPIPSTELYRMHLEALRVLSPNSAALAERIASALHPEVLSQSGERLARDLFSNLNPVGLQEAGCVTCLGVWLYGLAALKALSNAEVATFVADAATLGGSSGVVPL